MSAPDFRYLTVETEGAVATITLNRPEVLNACNPDMHREVQASMDWVDHAEDIKVAILTGAGRAFCSGSDLREVSKFQGVEAQRYLQLDFTTKNRVAACTKPVIAALHGHVAGGGFELALACDMRFVAENVLFSLPEINIGTIPGSGGLQRLPLIVGLGIAKEWALTGRRVDAQEAYRTGLANHVYPLESFLGETKRFAQDLATRSGKALFLSKVALDPTPPASAGMIGVYHMLASEACHDDPVYRERAGGFGKKAG
ncbi:Short-chain-enoyl-CoA hydratase [Ensifer psoraleae]|uniref:enoyl-CoA hydratase/isomerase family protein n=1 Tax=Sinorhizobium psoraleae TaxID=520838 RepID=UPI001568A988|nr:enoyl-CoA hydratase/isomerase family protein [Sinorhizobium psoraleae]NRP72182.1 Short-chain-enoyl-CoA hydratase [Sinorhizobium psoraleae]